MAAVPQGSRATRSQRTREELRRCALERFRRDGFHRTSVAAIARDAGVTERTFYRHFPSKEAVFFQDEETRVEWFAAALALRPRNESLLDSVRVAVESFPEDREVVRQVAQLRASQLSQRAIEAHLRQVQSALAREIEQHAAERLADGEDRELAAAVLGDAIAGALLAALEVWGRRGGADTDALRELTRQALDLLRHPPPV